MGKKKIGFVAAQFAAVVAAVLTGAFALFGCKSNPESGETFGRLEFYGVEIGSKVDARLFDCDEESGIWISKPLGPDSPLMFLRTNADGKIFAAVTLWPKLAYGFDFDTVKERSLGEFADQGAVVRRLENSLEAKAKDVETKDVKFFKNVYNFECHRVIRNGAVCLYQITDAEIKHGDAIVEGVYAHHFSPSDYEDYAFYEELIKSGK